MCSCILYIVYFIFYFVYCILYIVHSMWYMVYGIWYMVYCILYIVYCILYMCKHTCVDPIGGERSLTREREREEERAREKREQRRDGKEPLRVYVQNASVCTGKTPACVQHAGVSLVHTEAFERTHEGIFPRAKPRRTPHTRNTTHAQQTHIAHQHPHTKT